MGVLNDLFVRIKGDSTSLDGTLKKTENSIGSWGKKVAGLLAGVFGTAQLIRFGNEAVNLAAKMQGIREAFEKIATPGLLDELRASVKGTVDDMTLMQSAVRANNFKIPLSQLATFFEFAQKRAQQSGEAVDYLVESIIMGIGRKSPLILDNLGISAVELRNKFKGVGLESASVGEVAKAMGEIVGSELTRMGNVSVTAQTKISQIRAEWKNLKTEVGEAIVSSKAANSLLQWFNDILDMFKDPDLNFWQKFAGNPDEYKEFKRQQEEARTEWRKTLSIYDDIELEVRRGKWATEEGNKQIELEIKERKKNREFIEAEVRALKELNTIKTEGREKAPSKIKAGEGPGLKGLRAGSSDSSWMLDEINAIIGFDEKLSGANEAVRKWGEKYKQTLQGVSDDVIAMNNLTADAINSFAGMVTNNMESLFESIGSGNFDDLGKDLLMSFADFLSMLGKMMVAYGLLISGFLQTAANPLSWPVAVALGAAAIAAAGLIKGAISQGGGAITGRSGSSSTSGGMSLNQIKILIEGKISGRDIAITNRRYLTESSRNT